MSNNLRPVQGEKVIVAFAPETAATTHTGQWIDMGKCEHCSVVCITSQAHATPPVFNLNQSTIDGTSATRLTTSVNIWYSADSSNNDAYSLTTGTDFTCSTTTDKDKVVIFDVPSSALSSGYRYLSVTATDSTDNVTAALYLQSGLRYSQESPPTALAAMM